MPTIQIDPTMTAPLQVTRLADDARTGSFDIVLDLPGAGARGFPLRVSGTAVETAQTVVLARSLSRGDIVHESDLTVERHPKSETNRDVVSDMASVTGLALRRNLRAGQTLRASDLMKPELVHRNDFVTLVYEMPGIVLTSRGKAIEAGSEGEVVAVMNTQSRRTVQGTVTAAGTVAVTSMTPRFAANTIPETTGSVPAQRSRSE